MRYAYISFTFDQFIIYKFKNNISRYTQWIFWIADKLHKLRFAFPFPFLSYWCSHNFFILLLKKLSSVVDRVNGILCMAKEEIPSL
jgi:hypothetical protein